MTENIVGSEPRQPEVDHFPQNNQQELELLKEVIGDREVQVIPIGNAGYMVTKTNLPLIAEAPWTLVDFDDTAANTTFDKKGRCWPKLEEFGLSPDLVQHCDRISRVDLGDAGVIYQPELEMRLATRALERVENGDEVDVIKKDLDSSREEIVKRGRLREFPISNKVQDLYSETRYSSTLYPDVGETFKRLRGEASRPNNVAILTYGDPRFQLHKTISLIDSNEGLGTIFLTRVRKGDFFKALLEENPFENLKLSYTYNETERGVGIDFKSWRVMVTLFDDDPKQVESFNTFAEENEIFGVGVVRVRRRGAKYSDMDVPIPPGSAEVKLSDTLLDAGIFEHALVLLEAIRLERFLLDMFGKLDAQGVVDDPKTRGLIQAIADRRRQSYEQAKQSIWDKAGVIERGLAIDE